MLDTPCFPSDASSNNGRFEVDRAFSNHIHDNNNVTAPDLRSALLHNAPVAALYEQAIRHGEGK